MTPRIGKLHIVRSDPFNFAPIDALANRVESFLGERHSGEETYISKPMTETDSYCFILKVGKTARNYRF